MSTPEEEVRRRLLGEGESANYGQELLAQAQNMDPAEARRMLESAGFGVARPPSADEQRAMDQSRDYPANSATGFTPPPPVSEPDLSRPVDQQPRRRGRTRGEIKFRGGNKEPRDPNVMTTGDVFRASIGGPQYDEDVDTLSAGDIYRASMGANREPAPTAQEIYGDVDIPGTIARGISAWLNPPPRDPGSTRGGRKVRAADEPEPTGTRPVATQGEAPAADAVTQAENVDPTQRGVTGASGGFITQADVTPEMLARQREILAERPDIVGQNLPTTGPFQYSDQSGNMVAAPPSERPEESQVSDQAEPGQASGSESAAPQIPEGGLNRVRIHRMMGRNKGVTDAIVDAPGTGLSGLEGPAGLSDEDLVRFAGLQAQGIRGLDAQNLILRQRQVEAELIRAGAMRQNAMNNAVAYMDREREDGTNTRMFYRINPDGGISFMDTDMRASYEPMLGTQTTVTPMGQRETSSVVVYPSHNERGEINTEVPEMLDLSRWGAEPGSDQAARMYEMVKRMRKERYSTQEISDFFDAEFTE